MFGLTVFHLFRMQENCEVTQLHIVSDHVQSNVAEAPSRVPFSGYNRNVIYNLHCIHRTTRDICTIQSAFTATFQNGPFR